MNRRGSLITVIVTGAVLALVACGNGNGTNAATSQSLGQQPMSGTCTLGYNVAGQGYSSTGQFETPEALSQSVWAVFGPTSSNGKFQYQVVTGAFLAILSGQGTIVWSSGPSGGNVNGTGYGGPFTSESNAQSVAQAAYLSQNQNGTASGYMQEAPAVRISVRNNSGQLQSITSVVAGIFQGGNQISTETVDLAVEAIGPGKTVTAASSTGYSGPGTTGSNLSDVRWAPGVTCQAKV